MSCLIKLNLCRFLGEDGCHTAYQHQRHQDDLFHFVSLLVIKIGANVSDFL